MTEPLDVKKLLTSPFTGLYWVKVAALAFGIFTLLFVGYGLYKAYIKKPLPSTDQDAQVINNYHYEPHSGMFGCSTVRVKP